MNTNRNIPPWSPKDTCTSFIQNTMNKSQMLDSASFMFPWGLVGGIRTHHNTIILIWRTWGGGSLLWLHAHICHFACHSSWPYVTQRLGSEIPRVGLKSFHCSQSQAQGWPRVMMSSGYFWHEHFCDMCFLTCPIWFIWPKIEGSWDTEGLVQPGP